MLWSNINEVFICYEKRESDRCATGSLLPVFFGCTGGQAASGTQSGSVISESTSCCSVSIGALNEWLHGSIPTTLVPCLINKLAVVRKSGGGVPPPERPEAAPTLVRYNCTGLHPTPKELTRHGTRTVTLEKTPGFSRRHARTKGLGSFLRRSSRFFSGN